MACEEVTKYFPNLAAGWNPTLPPRAMDPDAGLPVLYTSSMNYVSRDGRLQRRAGVAPMAAGFQFAPWVAGDTTEVVMWCTTIDTAFADYATVAVTNYRIMAKWNKSASWKDCTPTYNAGTVSATNGSTTVTGSGTQWQTLRIGAFGKITISGVDFTITAVLSDTSMSIFPAYTGTTGGGKAYVITRFFNNLNAQSQFFASIFNLNLYVAGDYAGGSGNNGSDPQPAVIKVANFASSSSTSSYITARNVISTGLDACGVSLITGIQCLQDGRVVISSAYSATIYYSSLLNDAVWTSSPGGFTSVVLIPGRLNALGRLGNNLTLHHNAGVVWGYPTGQTDPPLGFQASSAREGCFASSTLRSDGVREFFVTASGCVKQFDGAQVEEIGAEVRPSLRTLAKAELAIMFGGLDPDRGRYYLGYNPTGLSYTFMWHLSIPSRVWHPLRIGHIIRAMSDGVPASDFAPTVRAILGLGLQPDGSSTSFLATLDEAASTDSGRTNIQLYMGGIFIVTDDIDFGDARELKVIRRVIVWADHVSGSAEQVQLWASGDNGLTWAIAIGSILTSNANEDVHQFCFDELAVKASTQFRIRLAPEDGTGNPNSTTMRPLRMLVVASKTGMIDFTSL